VKAAGGNHLTFTVGGKVSQHFVAVGVNNGGTYWHLKHPIVATSAGAITTLTGFSIVRAITAHVAVIDQGVQILVGFEDDTTPITTITAVRTTPGDVLFPAETKATVAAFPGIDADRDFVDKFHSFYLVTAIAIHGSRGIPYVLYIKKPRH